MEIEVGSKWVAKRESSTFSFEVLFVGLREAFCRFNDGSEGSLSFQWVETHYKLELVRRTVWLNVYEDEVQCYNSKNKADNNIGYGLLWQQEVELIDPREDAK